VVGPRPFRRGSSSAPTRYPLGAEILLKTQIADGRGTNKGIPRVHNRPPWNTALAILFLKRATRPLTDAASVDRYLPR